MRIIAVQDASSTSEIPIMIVLFEDKTTMHFPPIQIANRLAGFLVCTGMRPQRMICGASCIETHGIQTDETVAHLPYAD